MKITIVPKGTKGRVFSQELLAWVEADFLWEKGANSDNRRPIWTALAGSEQESKAFLANFTQGHLATSGYYRSNDEKFELLKSVKYRVHQQKISGGGVYSTVFLPEFFMVDPGLIDPEKISFVVLPLNYWIEGQSYDIERAKRLYTALYEITFGAQITVDLDWHTMLAVGSLFLLYLDRRCRYPMPFDPVFGAWLFLMCENAGKVVKPTSGYRSSFKLEIREPVGIRSGFAFLSDHETFGELLSLEIRRWFRVLQIGGGN
jgi:hypothetical protein